MDLSFSAWDLEFNVSVAAEHYSIQIPTDGDFHLDEKNVHTGCPTS
jgi:hypothetical protein